jgi:pyridoxamine 5'-phosphate oxidase
MELDDYIGKSRKDYDLGSLDEKSVHHAPTMQFQKWMQEAIQAGLSEPNAMTLSTVNTHAQPSSRIVLLRAFDEEGFVFYTNFNSRKGSDIQENPCGAINFFWAELHRQVRIEGKISKVSNEVSDSYFHSRPRESRIGAWVSDQSGILSSREHLDEQYQEFVKRFENVEVPRPPHWGGFILLPQKFEFWQGRPSRLHDRIEYLLDVDGKWSIRRLYP